MGRSEEKTTLQIRIDPERKARWKREHNERPKYRSMTHLIVSAVESELREDPVAGMVDVDLDSVHDRLDAIHDRLKDVENEVDDTKTMVRSDSMGGYDGLRERVQEVIPTGEREDILSRVPEQSPGDTPTDELEDVVSRTGSVPHLAMLLQREGHTPIEIRGIVEQLSDDVGTIEATYARPQESKDKRVYRVED